MDSDKIAVKTERRKVETRIWLQILNLENTIFSRLNNALSTRFGLSVAKFEFLAQVDRYPEGVTLGEISKNLKVTSGNVSGLVRRLLADKLITKTMSAADRRSFIVQFTPLGRDMFDKANALHAAKLAECFAGLPGEELDTLLARLKGLATHVQGQADEQS